MLGWTAGDGVRSKNKEIDRKSLTAGWYFACMGNSVNEGSYSKAQYAAYICGIVRLIVCLPAANRGKASCPV